MQLYANPYDTSANGFYFESAEDFEEKFNANLPVEEYEIDFIDGTDEQAALFKVASVTQANLAEWFDGMDQLREHEMAAAYFLLENGSVSSFSEAVEKADQLSFSEGDVKAYAEQFIDDMGGPSQLGKETLEMYFDYEAYARDMNYNGDAVEFTFGGTTYTADPNSV
jgi:antirestriction protein